MIRALRHPVVVRLALGLGLAGGLGVVLGHAFPGPLRLRQTGFDARRALQWARWQAAQGPRPAGSPAQRRVAARLRRALPSGHYEPVPGGLRNVVGELPGRGRPILLVAHYDTTPARGYVGADNAAAAVGVVVQVARVLATDARLPGQRRVRVLLSDGEEAPSWPLRGRFTRVGLRGTRADLAAGDRPYAVVVLDFVGHDTSFERQGDPGLWRHLRDAARDARALRLTDSPARLQVTDDHTPYLRAGVPAIDLIAWPYDCWQRPCDRPDRLRIDAIARTGAAVTELVRELRAPGARL